LIVTVGATLSHVTVLSVLVDAVLLLPEGSCTAFAAISAMTVPGVVMPLTAAFHVMLSEVVRFTVFVPPAVPVRVTSEPVKVAGFIASLKTTVKLMGDVPVGSAWPPAWLIVTVGGVTSTVEGFNDATAIAALADAPAKTACSVDACVPAVALVIWPVAVDWSV